MLIVRFFFVECMIARRLEFADKIKKVRKAEALRTKNALLRFMRLKLIALLNVSQLEQAFLT